MGKHTCNKPKCWVPSASAPVLAVPTGPAYLTLRKIVTDGGGPDAPADFELFARANTPNDALNFSGFGPETTKHEILPNVPYSLYEESPNVGDYNLTLSSTGGILSGTTSFSTITLFPGQDVIVTFTNDYNI